MAKEYYKSDSGLLYHGDNLDALKLLDSNSVDSCISDFPYDLTFYGKEWDNVGNFYTWSKERARELKRVLKDGSYVMIFGTPTTDHRMRCAFEFMDYEFIDTINWTFLNGFPKNLDISKGYDSFYKLDRLVIGTFTTNITAYQAIGQLGESGDAYITIPSSDNAKLWDGWKSSGLKPARETISIFRKPTLDTTIPKEFPSFLYYSKASPLERVFLDGSRNPHVTVKPVNLIKELIKMITPVGGTTLDITAGSGTHAVACEILNKIEWYNLKWINIELCDTETEPYCKTIIKRVSDIRDDYSQT